MLSLNKIPVKNMRTHPVRTLVLILLAFAQAVCFFGGLVMLQGMNSQLARAEARLGADLIVYPTAAVSKISMKDLLMQGTPVEVYKSRSMLDRMEDCDGIAASSCQIYLSDISPEGKKIWITGYEPETDFAISPWFADPAAADLPDGMVAAGSRVEVSAAQTVTLFGKDWPVQTRLLETGSLMDDSVYVSMNTLRMLIRAAEEQGNSSYSAIDPDTAFSSVLVRAESRERAESVTNWINIYVRKVTAVQSEAILSDTAKGIQSGAGTTAVIAAVLWVLLLAALFIVLSILMKERKKELYVWHAMGACRSLINKVLLKEAFLIQLAGAAAGVVIAAVVLLPAGPALLPGVVFSASFLVPAMVCAAAVTVAAGLLAAYLAVGKAIKTVTGQMLLVM